jgi:hypothetical protein
MLKHLRNGNFMTPNTYEANIQQNFINSNENYSNTSGAGTAYPSGAHEFTPGF